MKGDIKQKLQKVTELKDSILKTLSSLEEICTVFDNEMISLGEPEKCRGTTVLAVKGFAGGNKEDIEVLVSNLSARLKWVSALIEAKEKLSKETIETLNLSRFY